MEGGAVSELVSIAALLREGVSIGDIATGIERFGVRGEDRFGRMLPFRGLFLEMIKIRSSLASLAMAWRSGVDLPLLDTDRFAWLHRCGWFATELPDFERLDDAEPTVPAGRVLRVRARAASRRAVTNGPESHREYAVQRIVDSLVKIILGAWPGVRRPTVFVNLDALIRFLAEKFAGFHGMTRRKITEKVLEAADLADEAAAMPRASADRQPSRRFNGKRIKASLRLVGALTLVIEGEPVGIPRHPDVADNDALVLLLEESFVGDFRLSRTAVKGVLLEGLDLVGQ